MPPAKSRNSDDSKLESGHAKEKGNGHTSAKMRRITSQQGPSSLREVQNASFQAPTQSIAESINPSIQWSSFNRETLHNYRRHYHMNTPSSFTSTYHQMVLSQKWGIGKYSPTVQARKGNRQSKEQLAMAVRKHFNGVGIQENDVIVDFISKIRSENAEKSSGPNKQSPIITTE